ncbi:MAG: hypothetical protein GXO85_12090 [Chlorobi bacterium]|nr:hypothetical protein [Chlorobiota bacterium]
MEDKIFEFMNRYFDDDLNREEEIYLFSRLSSNDQARDDFKAMNLLRESAKSSMEDFTLELNNKAYTPKEQKEKKQLTFTFHVPTVIGYAFSIILLIISLLTYNQSLEYKKDIKMKVQQINYQNKLLELMFNSFPQTEIRTTYSKDTIIKPKS